MTKRIATLIAAGALLALPAARALASTDAPQRAATWSGPTTNLLGERMLSARGLPEYADPAWSIFEPQAPDRTGAPKRPSAVRGMPEYVDPAWSIFARQ